MKNTTTLKISGRFEHLKEKSSYNHNYYKVSTGESTFIVLRTCDEGSGTFEHSIGKFDENDRWIDFGVRWDTWFDEDVFERQG